MQENKTTSAAPCLESKVEITYGYECGTIDLHTIKATGHQRLVITLPESYTEDTSIRELMFGALEVSETLLQAKETVEETRNRHKALALASEKALSRERAIKFIKLGHLNKNRTLLVGGLLKLFEIDHCYFRAVPDMVMKKRTIDMAKWLEKHMAVDARHVIKAGCFNSDMKNKSFFTGARALKELPIYPLMENGYITGIDWEHEDFQSFLHLGCRGVDIECLEYTYPEWRIGEHKGD